MENSRRLQDKVALVTGAGQGIGRVTAIRLAQDGCKVAVNGRIAHPKINDVVRETGGIPVIADIAQVDQVKTMVKEVEEQLGPIEILVANAARMTMLPFLEQDPAQWWEQVDVNLTGHISCIHAALPGMRRIGAGRIILISSFFGTLGWKNATGYSASKSGISALGESLAAELKSENISVSIIAPGIIDTPQLQVDADDLNVSREEVKAIYARDIPLGRVADPKEVAATVAFLAAEGGPIYNGCTLHINGGNCRCSK
ncbi:Oxidoreductase, short-chain dehydrogenase/reductase family [Olavius sp. associated proteobacterium Delta 1]|nr:Oxidoreductase, short-chain dehydrogenase/reductase family [Olavius sp. associated proteobacterium Delta 1]